MSIDNDPSLGTIIFSLVNETVLASWHGKSEFVELGPLEAVTYMMRDFLAQCDLGERLATGTYKSALKPS